MNTKDTPHFPSRSSTTFDNTPDSRTSRGLARLRKTLSSAVTGLTVVALTQGLSAEAAAASSAGALTASQVAAIQGAAMGAGDAAAASVTSIAKGTVKAMFWIQMKTAAAMLALAGVVGLGGAGGFLRQGHARGNRKAENGGRGAPGEAVGAGPRAGSTRNVPPASCRPYRPRLAGIL